MDRERDIEESEPDFRAKLVTDWSTRFQPRAAQIVPNLISILLAANVMRRLLIAAGIYLNTRPAWPSIPEQVSIKV